MDAIRIVLYACLFGLAYLLVDTWDKDSQTIDTQSKPAQVAQTSDMPIVGQGRQAVQDEDIPSGAIPEPKLLAAQQTSQSFIQVQTDVLSLQINPLGGDIIDLQLPQYPVKLEENSPNYQLMVNEPSRVFVAQSGLIGRDGPDGQKNTAGRTSRPVYQSKAQSYQLADGQEQMIVDLEYQTPQGVRVTKRFEFQKGSYAIQVSFLIDNQSSASFDAQLFAQFKRDRSPAAGEVEGIGMQPFLGGAFFLPDEPYYRLSFDDVDENKEERNNFRETVPGGWVALVQHYFVSSWVPNQAESHTYQARKLSASDIYIYGFTSPSFSVPAQEQTAYGLTLYAGPKILDNLESLAPHLDLTIDFGWLWFLGIPLYKALLAIFSVVGNWGWAIVILTFAVKIILYWPSAKSYESMAKMREAQPDLLRIRDKYANDRQRQSQEMMKLYKDKGINPLGGCLPILLQMPVFLALYWVFFESVELRQAPFIFWIQDLSVKDPYFVLPIIMGVSMYFMQKLNPAPQDPMQAKIMQLMPIMFTVLFVFFPAGLVLYWVVNNLLSIAQQWWITRRIAASSAVAKAS